ncbi:MAG: response regulator transcription factor [Phycisphaeraceae bacterium]|nr:response regulator transcription factor [Phycisphaeraceae bacterium]
MRLLLIEDSWRLLDSLSEGLRRCGHAVETARTLRDARAILRGDPFEAIVLDRRLPDGEGLDILDELRARGDETHVLVLTARDTIDDKVSGLSRGADDYLVKPFAFDELVARLNAIYRRSQRHVSPTLTVRGLTIDTAARQASSEQGTVDLTAREYALLEFLAFRAGEVVHRRDLETHLYRSDSEPTSNAVDRLVCSVRAKLAQFGVDNLIETRRGMGYTIARPAS